MRRRFLTSVLALSAVVLAGTAVLVSARAGDEAEDPFLWLEEIRGERALAWVAEQNTASQAELTKHPAFAEIEAHTLSVLEAEDRIELGERHGEFMYDLWRDAANPRGVYRRTTVASYLAGAPEWEVVLDVDALAAKEGRSWVWKGIDLCRPEFRRGLVRLSDGGTDAVFVRELDIPSKSFVEDGFNLPEAKSGIGWIDADTVFVDTDLGPGTLTDSGYPRIVKRWRRDEPLADAEVVLEANREAVSVGAYRDDYGDTKVDWVYQSPTFFTSATYVLRDGELRTLGIPDTAKLHTVFDGRMVVELKEPWIVGDRTFPAGAVISTPLDGALSGDLSSDVVIAPTDTTSVTHVTRTKSYLLAVVMDDVRDRLFRLHRSEGEWVREEITFPGHGTTWVSNADVDHDDFFVSSSSFLRPTTLYHVDATTLGKVVVEQEPARFDAEPYEARQMFATSADGTRVPYFVVAPKGMEAHGHHPTLLYGYGGFRIPMRPRYLGALGQNWLARGGVYVLANIRGGAEYGPRWHDAARKASRHRAFEDFEAVAGDLIAKRITSPAHLGIQGGSNGGLLVGACFTRRPELFGAVVCQVPLLDMRRFNKLLAGASWMDEYGNPDIPEEWAFIRTYSPYHNLSKDATYPRVLFMTSTKDDRVHPGHARKMVARMMSMGHPVLYYENTEGGHAGAADARQRAHSTALSICYLLTELTGDE